MNLEHTPNYLKGLLQRAEDELSATRAERERLRAELERLRAACNLTAEEAGALVRTVTFASSAGRLPPLAVAVERIQRALHGEQPATDAKPDSLQDRVAVLERDNALLWRLVERCAVGRGPLPACAREALDARKAGG